MENGGEAEDEEEVASGWKTVFGKGTGRRAGRAAPDDGIVFCTSACRGKFVCRRKDYR